MNKVNLMDILEFLLSINQTGLDVTWQINLTDISIEAGAKTPPSLST